MVVDTNIDVLEACEKLLEKRIDLEKWKGNLQNEYDFAILAVEVDALYYVADLLL